MIKKYICVGLLLIMNATVQAYMSIDDIINIILHRPRITPEEAYCYRMLNIVIRNQTHSVCRLESQDIFLGEINSKMNLVPIKILPDEETKAYSIVNPASMSFQEGPDATLTYSCGTDKLITIRSRLFSSISAMQEKGKRVKLDQYIFGSILSVSNMNAYFEVHKENCEKNSDIPNTIIWTFK